MGACASAPRADQARDAAAGGKGLGAKGARIWDMPEEGSVRGGPEEETVRGGSRWYEVRHQLRIDHGRCGRHSAAQRGAGRGIFFFGWWWWWWGGLCVFVCVCVCCGGGRASEVLTALTACDPFRNIERRPSPPSAASWS